MFRPENISGLGNVLMQLCHSKKVSSHIYHGGRGKYIEALIPVIDDDGTLEAIPTPHLILDDSVHMNIDKFIKPTEECNRCLKEYEHLIKDVSYALQIRIGVQSSNPAMLKYGNSVIFCDENDLKKFHDIIRNTPGNVYISSDCLVTKRKFRDLYPDRVRIIDEEPVYIVGENQLDPKVTFMDFFLLSKCPAICITAGALDSYSISTFGYMAAMYGKIKPHGVFNDSLKTKSQVIVNV